jgi:hypothetical protein
MTGLWRNRKMLTLAAVALACVVALLSIEWVSPQPMAHLLGSDWQCSRIAFITTCSRVQGATPVVHSLREDPVCVSQDRAAVRGRAAPPRSASAPRSSG